MAMKTVSFEDLKKLFPVEQEEKKEEVIIDDVAIDATIEKIKNYIEIEEGWEKDEDFQKLITEFERLVEDLPEEEVNKGKNYIEIEYDGGYFGAFKYPEVQKGEILLKYEKAHFYGLTSAGEQSAEGFV